MKVLIKERPDPQRIRIRLSPEQQQRNQEKLMRIRARKLEPWQEHGMTEDEWYRHCDDYADYLADL